MKCFTTDTQLGRNAQKGNSIGSLHVKKGMMSELPSIGSSKG